MLRPSFVVLLLAFLAADLANRGGPQDTATAPIRGVVTDEGGATLGGVRYWISGFERRDGNSWRLLHRSGEPRYAWTGPDGSFEVPGHADLRYDVDFDADGYSPAFLLQAEPGSQHQVVMRKGRTVSGSVVQQVPGGPKTVAHAPVSVRRSNPRGLWFERKVATDADGLFVFRHVLPIWEDGACEWSLDYAGARLSLDPDDVEGVDDILIEVRIEREGG